MREREREREGKEETGGKGRKMFSNKRNCSQQTILIHSFEVFFQLGHLPQCTPPVFDFSESAFSFVPKKIVTKP